MAPVMPTMSSRSSAASAMASANTEVQDRPELALVGWPVSGSIVPTAWNMSSTSAIAGA